MSIITPSHITMNKNDADGNFGKGRFFIEFQGLVLRKK